MQKIIYLFLISFLWGIPSCVYAIDELDKEFKSQLEYYNKEILSKTEEAKNKLEILESILSFKNKAFQRGASSEYRIAEAKEVKTYREINDIKEQLKSLNTNRQKLKIKVLKEYGSLPDWWVELDPGKEKICSISPSINNTFNL